MQECWTMNPSILQGEIQIPSARNALHRSIIAASLSHGKSTIQPFIPFDELLATLKVIKAFGASYKISNETLTIKGAFPPKVKKKAVFIGHSMTTLKLTLPIALTLNGPFTYKIAFDSIDASLHPFVHFNESKSRVTVNKRALNNAPIHLNTLESSRLINGFLLAAPLYNDSKDFSLQAHDLPLDFMLTLSTMKSFNHTFIENNEGFSVPKNTRYEANDVLVEGDYGIGGFFLIAGLKNPSIRISNISHFSYQSDYSVINLIKKASGKIIHDEHGYLTAESELNGFKTSFKNKHSVLPHGLMLAALSNEPSTLIKLKSYKQTKEDTLNTLLKTLGKFNIRYKFHSNTLIVHGTSPPFNGPSEITLDENFRIALFQFFMCTFNNKPTTIKNMQSITNHYKNFYTLMRALNADINNGKPLN